ncbi:methyltransferase, FkbM family [Rhizobiales bacterium GAS188]|nr:methyltransferase, FkbM family [Rhizobiales bacterium GAS188]
MHSPAALYSPSSLELLLARYRDEWTAPPTEFMQTELGTRVRRAFYDPHRNMDGEYSLRALSGILGEEVFQFIHLLQSIDEAEGSWTMAEIGAGYGRWLVAGARTVRRVRSLPAHLIAVEAEDAHFEMLKLHLSDNGFDPNDHHLIKGAASGKDGHVFFTQGHAAEWYGQAIIPSEDSGFGDWPKATVVTVPSFSLATILGEADRVDYLDMDIQGAELDAVSAAIDVLSSKVRRLQIGTHSQSIEDGLRSILSDAGWQCQCDYACGATALTPFGRIAFVDGSQGWANPSLRVGPELG